MSKQEEIIKVPWNDYKIQCSKAENVFGMRVQRNYSMEEPLELGMFVDCFPKKREHVRGIFLAEKEKVKKQP